MRNVLRRWLPLVMAFVIGASMVGSAWAAVTKIKGNLTVTGVVKAKNFRFLNQRTQRVVIPGSAFIADDSGDDVTHWGYSGALNFGSGGGDAVAPVYLPQGAVVTKVTWMYAGAAGSTGFHLERNFGFGDHVDMLNKTAAGCASEPCTQSFGPAQISPNTINNNTGHYGLWLWGTNAQTFKFIIHYKTATAVGSGQSVPTGPGLSSEGGTTATRDHERFASS